MMYDLIEEYLIHSYIYYVVGDSVINDQEFDRLCVELVLNWDSLESPFKDEVDIPDDKDEGTVDFQLKGQDGYEESYSTEIKRSAHIRLAEHQEAVEDWESFQY